MFIRRIYKILLAVAALLILSTTAYAFAASNTVPTTNAGDGENTISGYSVTNVHYNLDAGNPSNVATVTFTISPALPGGGTVRIQMVSGGSWYSCSVAGGTSVTCTTTGAAAVDANNLRIVIAQ
jgi:hypothetical protein